MLITFLVSFLRQIFEDGSFSINYEHLKDIYLPTN